MSHSIRRNIHVYTDEQIQGAVNTIDLLHSILVQCERAVSYAREALARAQSNIIDEQFRIGSLWNAAVRVIRERDSSDTDYSGGYSEGMTDGDSSDDA